MDGDTVDVMSGGVRERVRIIGVDTPERGECGFDEASRALADLLAGEHVHLTEGAQDDRDRYGRLLRYVDVAGTDAGLALIERGLAVARYDSRDGYGAHTREDTYVTTDARTDMSVCDAATQPETGSPGAEAGSSGRGTGSPDGEPALYANCAAARQAGAAPVYRGDPGYASHLDGDNDGVGCE